jgi:hypothetical protein
MVTPTKFHKRSDNLFESLGFCWIGSELINNGTDHFGTIIKKILMNEFIYSFAVAAEKTLLINLEILIDIRWKFHLNNYKIYNNETMQIVHQ